MTVVDRPVRLPMRAMRQHRLTLVGYGTLAGLVGYWAWRAIRDPHFYDFELAYQAGQAAWSTGQPEHVITWTGTPLYALVMAIMTRIGSVVSMGRASHLLTVLNITLVIGAVTTVMRRLRHVITPIWWWTTAAALLTFGPMMSTVWWKQINLISLVLALAGFDLMRRGRARTGGGLIGLSVAFKPLVILLPLVLLAQRETRRAGTWALGCLIGASVVAQEVLAVHAASASAINPLSDLQNFAGRANNYSCATENYSPGSLLCRLTHSGLGQARLWNAVGAAAAILLFMWVLRVLRGRRGASWEMFAFTCAISPMLSPIDWTHYQVMLAPLFVLLMVRFSRDRAGALEWAGLAVAFGLASLMWRPYDTPVDVVQTGLSSLSTLSQAFFTPFTQTVADIGQFAQYALILSGLRWYARHPVRTAPQLDGPAAEGERLAPSGPLGAGVIRALH